MKHYRFWIILVVNLLLIFSLSQADLVGDDQGRFISIDYIDYIPQNLLPNATINVSNTTTRSTFQAPTEPTTVSGRIGSFVPPDTTSQNTPLRGSLIGPDNGYLGYYVLLGDDGSDENVTYNISIIDENSAPIKVNEPIRLQQTLEITSTQNETMLHKINLWNHINALDRLAVQGSRSISVYVNNTFQSEQPIFELLLKPGETKTIFVEYIHEPVTQEVNCQDQELVDLLPPGAIIQHTDISLETILSSRCTVTIQHDYDNAVIVPVEVDLSEFPYLEGLTGTQESTNAPVEVRGLSFEITP